MNDIFITEDFLLDTDKAVELYESYARDMPIIDYHCHLPVKQIADDHQFHNLTQIWLNGDYYKWRANGIDEQYCTGDASDLEALRKRHGFFHSVGYVLSRRGSRGCGT